MTGRCGDVPIDAWRYSYGPYWIVLFSSLWREPLLLLLLVIDTVLKVWSGSWQRLRESQEKLKSSFNALSQGKQQFSKPLSFFEMTLILLVDL